jgi:predicted  nucleic acid-binding Zn-ribbon protein
MGDPDSFSVKVASAEQRFRSLMEGNAQDMQTRSTRVDEDVKRLRGEMEDLRMRQGAVENDFAAYKGAMEVRISAVEQDVRKEVAVVSKHVKDVQREVTSFKEDFDKIVDDVKYKLSALAQALIRHGDEVRDQIQDETSELQAAIKAVDSRRVDSEGALRIDFDTIRLEMQEERDKRRELVETVKKMSDTLMELPQAVDAKVEMRWKEVHRKMGAMEREMQLLDQTTAGRVTEVREQLEDYGKSMSEISASFSRMQSENETLKHKAALSEREARAWESAVGEDVRSHISVTSPIAKQQPYSSLRVDVDHLREEQDQKMVALEGSLQDLRHLVHAMEHSPSRTAASASARLRAIASSEEDEVPTVTATKKRSVSAVHKKKTSTVAAASPLKDTVSHIMGGKSKKSSSSASAGVSSSSSSSSAGGAGHTSSASAAEEQRRNRLRKLYEEVLALGKELPKKK